MTIIYLVWTGYEDVEAAFFNKEDAERWVMDYIRDHPLHGFGRPRLPSDLSITEIECK